MDAALGLARELRVSSLHVLFPRAEEMRELGQQGFLLRKDCQFHWHNRGYASFDDFLEQFTAEKRKKARRERRRVAEAGIHFEFLRGGEISDAHWQAIMPLYAGTFWRRGREPYLNEAFFRLVARALPDELVVVLAMQATTPVAVAILFRSHDTLYGRYWGSSGEFHSLHFETCYYQGIEYCIREGLHHFEPGTQGEHKIARGFVPQEVWSAHWLSDARFAAAVDQYLERERAHIDQYIGVVEDHVPYRQTGP
jgi:predicted N-acyltransferase